MDDNIIGTRTEVRANPVGTRQFPSLSLPSDTVLLRRRVSGVYSKHVVYLFGKYSPRGLVRFPEEGQMYAVGIAAPSAPTTALLAAGILDAVHIHYLEYRHKIDGVIKHRSNLSAGSASVTSDGDDQVRVTIGAAAPAPDDDRVTHVGIYRSDDGDLPREVGEVTIGTTTFDDNISSDARGSSPPTTANGLSIANRRGVPPYMRQVVKWHKRLLGWGNPDHPTRVYFSEVDEFESFGESSYVEPLDGEPVSGLVRADDQLLITCYPCTYEVTGYRISDFVVRKVNSAMGCISWAGIVSYTDNQREKVIFPSQRGPVLYDGGFSFIFEDLERFWKDDYERFPDAYHDMIGAEDWEEHIVKLLLNTPRTLYGQPDLDSEGNPLPLSNPILVQSFYYIGHYLRWHPSFIGGPPQMMWTRMLRARKDSTIGYLADDSGRRVSYTMGCDGYIRRENVQEDEDDDGDLWQKRWRIKTGHDFPRGPGGDAIDGVTLDRFWAYMQAEEDVVLLNVWFGDESTAEPNAEGVDPVAPVRKSFPAGAEVGAGGADLVPDTLKTEDIRTAGRGHTRELLVYGPRGIRYSGWGAIYTPGGGSVRQETVPLSEVE